MRNLGLYIAHWVNFRGNINDHNVLKKYFKRAFAYVSPDAIGLGAQHSFAYGVPVITTSSGFQGAEYHNLEHDINCLLFKEPEDLELILLQLIKDRELVKRLGTNAYQKYKTKLSIDCIIKGFKDAITYSLKSKK